MNLFVSYSKSELMQLFYSFIVSPGSFCVCTISLEKVE